MKNSANARSSHGFQGLTPNEQSDEPASEPAADQVIIQCPRCQTKFAVDGALINPIDAPRFHCSRCDNVFSLPEYSQSYLPFKELRNSAKPKNSAEKSEGGRKPSRSLEIPRGLDADFEFGAPHENSAAQEEPEQVSFSFFPKRESAAPRHHGISFSVQDMPDPAPASALAEEFPAFSFADVKGESTRWERMPRVRIPRLQPSLMVLVVTPLIAFLSVLAAAGYYVRTHAAVAERLWPGIPQPAPAGLQLKDVKFRTVTLDNGGLARVVSGTVVNDSASVLKDVQLEGLLFNPRGELIERSKVHAGATLAKTRIRSLSPEMIARLQSGRLARPFQLTPGEELEFAFAIQGPELRDAAYYSARIHSVKY